MRYACEGAKSHMLRRAQKPPSLATLYNLSSQATHEAVHLLCQMLVFDPVSFASREDRYYSFTADFTLDSILFDK